MTIATATASKAPPTTARATTHLAMIFLGDNEWGSDLMKRIAAQYISVHPTIAADLAVMVYEHAGWYLTFAQDGLCIDTANDMAVLSPAARAWHERHRGGPTLFLESIRRP